MYIVYGTGQAEDTKWALIAKTSDFVRCNAVDAREAPTRPCETVSHDHQVIATILVGGHLLEVDDKVLPTPIRDLQQPGCVVARML